MSHKSHVCESCSKLCEEAKSNVKKLQKKIYILTIVTTSAITLLGEQGGKALLSSLNTVNSAMSVAEGKLPEKNKDNHAEQEKVNPVHPTKGAWIPARNKFITENTKKEPVKKYEITDELSRFTKKEKENTINVVEPKIPQNLLAGILSTEQTQPLTIQKTNGNIPQISDNFSVFFTPSLLPFDVYSTTLALGNNYGFGDYYGIDAGYIPSANVPDSSTVSILTLGTFINTRKRLA
jgi:hypothetical protein